MNYPTRRLIMIGDNLQQMPKGYDPFYYTNNYGPVTPMEKRS